MDDVGNLRGVARPAPHLRMAMRLMHGQGTTIPLTQALDDAQAIEGLAKVLEHTMNESKRDDGTIDFCLQAAHIIKATRKAP